MTDMRRTLLWVVFSMSLFLIWDAWQRHNGQPSLFSPPPTKVAASGAAGQAKVPTGAQAAAGTQLNNGTLVVANVVAERVEITTDVVKATLSGEGGSLIRLELLKYQEPVPKQRAESGFFDEVARAAVDLYQRLGAMLGGRAVDTATRNVVLFNQSDDHSYYVAESGLAPTGGDAGFPNHHTVMAVVPGQRTLQAGQDALQVVFESPVIGGVKLVKTYTFRRGDYVVNVKNAVTNEAGVAVKPRLYLQLVRDGVPPPGGSGVYSTFTGPAIDDGSKFQKVEFKSIDKRGSADKEDHTTEADGGWIAMVQHYFASAWLIDVAGGVKQPRAYFTGKADLTNPSTGAQAHVYSVGMFVPLGEIGPGATKTFDARLFVGPQEEEKLAALAPRLELVKDYGIFKLLAEPLFWLLTQLHKLIGNWGWSIVGLVLILRVAFFWLNLKAYTSMARMKAVNPRITELRERMKDKPQQLQQEMMKIYREEKINPLGSCLPMLLQMPFFISLYWVLLSTVEMRNAPWIGWITDLSAKDPFFILPLLMTGTSLLQTWLNPTPADPVQAKMMWIMPLAFSVMFFVFPSGLVLYWLTNNILSIAQQYLINKKLGVLGK
ncbi:MAG: membrane protein insertase YidC [Burkholderiales bacterium]